MSSVTWHSMPPLFLLLRTNSLCRRGWWKWVSEQTGTQSLSYSLVLLCAVLCVCVCLNWHSCEWHCCQIRTVLIARCPVLHAETITSKSNSWHGFSPTTQQRYKQSLILFMARTLRRVAPGPQGAWETTHNLPIKDICCGVSLPTFAADSTPGFRPADVSVGKQILICTRGCGLTCCWSLCRHDKQQCASAHLLFFKKKKNTHFHCNRLLIASQACKQNSSGKSALSPPSKFRLLGISYTQSSLFQGSPEFTCPRVAG